MCRATAKALSMPAMPSDVSSGEQSPGSAGGDRRLDGLFRTAEVREAIDVLGQLSHDPFLSPAGLRRRSRPGKAFAI
jgi:hypothetical protein